MKTSKHQYSKNEINYSIIKITRMIHDKFPELNKYIEEMPNANCNYDSTEISSASLEIYLNALAIFYNRYNKINSLNSKTII